MIGTQNHSAPRQHRREQTESASRRIALVSMKDIDVQSPQYTGETENVVEVADVERMRSRVAIDVELTHLLREPQKSRGGTIQDQGPESLSIDPVRERQEMDFSAAELPAVRIQRDRSHDWFTGPETPARSMGCPRGAGAMPGDDP
jgi:hypothetical protein